MLYIHTHIQRSIYVHLLLLFFYSEHDFRINIEKLLSYLRAYVIGIRCTYYTDDYISRRIYVYSDDSERVRERARMSKTLHIYLKRSDYVYRYILMFASGVYESIFVPSRIIIILLLLLRTYVYICNYFIFTHYCDVLCIIFMRFDAKIIILLLLQSNIIILYACRVLLYEMATTSTTMITIIMVIITRAFSVEGFIIIIVSRYLSRSTRNIITI